MLKVLLTGAGGAGNEALQRLWRNRYDLHFADADPEAFAPSIPDSRRHTIPTAADPRFANALAELCDRTSIKVLVPGVDEELPFLGAVASRLPRLRILAPAADYVTTMLDKLSAMSLLISHGVAAPRTTTLDRAADIGFPCFAKPRWGRGSRGIEILRDAAAASAYAVLSQRNVEQTVVQELLVGQEYTVMLAADSRSRLRAIVPVRVDRKLGITLRAETENQDRVSLACKAIHTSLPTRGCYNVQLIVTDDGRVRPFEINPRVSTTMCLGVASGIDPIAVYLEETPPDGLLPFRAGVRLRRHWHNEIS